MFLRLGTGKGIDNPAADDLREALRSFDGSEESFLILEEDPITRNFIQAAGDGERFVLEFAEAQDQLQWVTRDKDLPFETAVTLLSRYLNRDESYKTLVKWEVQELRSGCATTLLLVAFAAAALCVIV